MRAKANGEGVLLIVLRRESGYSRTKERGILPEMEGVELRNSRKG